MSGQRLSNLVDCNAQIRSDTTGRGAVDPLHRLRQIVVLADIAHEFPLQIGHRGEHAAGDDIALDLGEPELDLVEPGRIGRGVMQMHVRMSGQEILDTLTATLTYARLELILPLVVLSSKEENSNGNEER